ncbi:MAG: type IV pilin protein [Candidatus Accumulibacter sp.]|nr:type IV pilin protein [Accumulibacter sp.]
MTEAISGLSARQTRMEQCYQDNHTYAPATPCKACAKETTENFEFTCAADASTFTLTATGRNTMDGFIYTVDQSDAKSTTGAPAGWGTNSTCWVTKKGGVC